MTVGWRLLPPRTGPGAPPGGMGTISLPQATAASPFARGVRAPCSSRSVLPRT